MRLGDVALARRDHRQQAVGDVATGEVEYALVKQWWAAYVGAAVDDPPQFLSADGVVRHGRHGARNDDLFTTFMCDHAGRRVGFSVGSWLVTKIDVPIGPPQRLAGSLVECGHVLNV